MDINTALVISFFLATLFETLVPGPTFLLVTETRLSAGKKSALEVVAGVTLANFIWVISAIFLLLASNALFSKWLHPVIIYLGTFYLLYLASQRIISSMILLVTNCSLEQSEISNKRNHFLTGFIAHIGNPLTVTYYLATFGIATTGQSIETKIAFGAIAILSDLFVYGFIAGIYLGGIETILKKPIIRLIAGCALFYLIAHVYTKETNPEIGLTIDPVTMLVMLFGLLWAAMHEAYLYVRSRKDKYNKFIWRIAKLWSIWFSLFAIIGMFYSLVSGINDSALELSADIEFRIRVCVVTAAVIAVALTFFKSFGEVQDELYPNQVSESVSKNCWQASPFIVGIVIFLIMLGIFSLMTITNFSIQ